MKDVKLSLMTVIIVLFSNIMTGQDKVDYKVAENVWHDGYGNHRAVLKVEESSDAAYLNFNWRRHDDDPEKRRFLIVNESTGDTVKNIYRLEVDKEKCELVFGPVETGKYHFYYLPFKPDHKYGFYRYGYLSKEVEPDGQWLKNNKLNNPKKIKKLNRATCLSIEARKEFDSFFPMGVTATKEETENFMNQSQDDYIIIGEDRKDPVRMRDHIPLKWIKNAEINRFQGVALRNEYYAFQLGILASRSDVKNLRLEFEDLRSEQGEVISSSAFTCFNTTGVDPYGVPFTKRVDVNKGKVQALWIGTDIQKTLTPGTYSGRIKMMSDELKDQFVSVVIKVLNDQIKNRGDDEPWRHSRLRWLNSTIGLDNEPVAPYEKLKIDENKVGLTGKNVVFDSLGLPSSIEVFDTEVLSNAITIDLIGQDQLNMKLKNSEALSGRLRRAYIGKSDDFSIENISTTEFDGHINFKIKLIANKDTELEDFKLNIPFKSDVAEYMMGMGMPGTTTPKNHQAKWSGPHDSFWLGNTYGGLHVELRGSSYHGPLLNLYKPKPPMSWHNGGRGGFSISKNEDQTLATVYTGKRSFSKDEEMEFEFSILITPVRKVDTHAQFSNRYYHNGNDPMPRDEEIVDGVKVINVHHANEYNPYINYPFIATQEMKSFVDQMHARDLKVKIYYTIRELTNRVVEIWALRSLGNEILGSGRGGAYPWLQEHFVNDYHPQWYAPFNDGEIDASVLTAAGDSRWYNYYLEGLSWLVKHMDIDGLYLDDVSYDRRIVKRMRKVLDEVKPGCMLDLHSNTGFSKGPATQYTEYFPYLDKLWFGESFKYDDMSPENWLVEVSGIPFGHMGDMLHAGGNPWRGMVYGMTVRYPWFTEGVTCDPRDIWGVWDSFGIADSRMIGYWDKNHVVSTGHPNVKATAYVKEDKLLISLASWAEEKVKVNLKIDWETLKIDTSEMSVIAPEIDNFQPRTSFALDEAILVEPNKGWLLIFE